ncbi:LRR receptor-like serine/threonine-protein kinase ERL1 [Carex littledalei]|uniref:LRR receptor-like serine/threonine-protein kinase ERL1 n=1 Tax=Carex littledalei TaxID=544730 RepID=A0A833V9Y2_9POAL|nr:LRR receptor-like serine/threonine-protein kinase ERL1 [Carex littledalei]
MAPIQLSLHSVLIFSLYLYLSLSFASAILHPVDYLTLQSIHRSMSDLPGSSFFSSWDFTTDPCTTFTGVSCSGGRIVSLSLGDPRAGSPGLAGTLPASIGRLTALTDLSLVPGRVTGTIPPAIFHLPNLRFLALSSNLLSGQLPNSLSPFFRTIDISSNRLSGFLPASLFHLRGLTTLILSHNRFVGSIPNLVSSPLTHLDLKNNLLSRQIPALPSSLQYLSLSSNHLSGQVDNALAKLVNLNYLDLSFNLLSGSIPGTLFSFPIRSLQLQRNSFSGHLYPTSPIREGALLDLSYNQLIGTIPKELSIAGTIYLNSNKFFGEVPGEFVQRLAEGKIRLLYLQHNYLTKIIIGSGAVIPVSASVCVQDNCLVPPVGMTACPVRSGRRKTRPAWQCSVWAKG